MSVAWVALGSNLGDRARNLERALELLAAHTDLEVVARSSWIETDPVGGPPQGRYLNGVVRVATTRDPRELLDLLLAIEKELGRQRPPGQPASSPRTLDLDLLSYDDRLIDEPGLRVPHPRLHLRRFVLEPLAELAPHWRHPETGRTAADLLAGLEGK
jgi:2-amino-4-hydroxy-6-hydroxymethyldihydropteridine diphosphokinase